MHSFVQMNGQHRQVGPPSQAAPHPPNDATRSWSANNVHQYMTANSGVQPSQNVYFVSQNGVYPIRQNANLQSSEGLPLAQNKNGFPPITCGSQISTQQHSRQYSVNQGLPSPSNPNTTYSMQNMTVCWSQSATVNEKLKVGNLGVPHLQQNRDSQKFYPCSTKSNSSYTTSSPSLFQRLNYKAGSFVSAAPQNVQTSQRVSNQNCRPSCVESGSSSDYTQNCSMGTPQSFGSNSAASQSFSNGQVAHFFNTSQMTQQSATLINSSYYNCEGSTNSRNASLNDQNNSKSFLRDTNELPINSAGAQQQMLRNQGSAGSLGNSYTTSNGYCLPPPPYESHCVDESRMSNQNIQPVTSARSESSNLNAFQPQSLHSKQSLPQNVMSRGHLPANPHLQQNTLPEAFNVNTAEDRGEREKAVDVSLPNGNAISKQYLASSPSDGPQVQQTPKKISTQRNDLYVIFKNHPHLLQILGFHPTGQCNDSSAHSGKAHTGTRAVAVVPPLSQDDGQTSNSPTCNSINGMEIERITPDVEKEAACVEEETNLDQEMPNPVRANEAASNEVAVLINSGCESRSSPQSCEQRNLNPTALRGSECSSSQTSPEEQSGAATPPSPPVFELSSLPTYSWTMKALNNLIGLTKTSERKSKDNIIQLIMELFWDKNIQTFIRSYNAALQTEFFSDIEKVCAQFNQDTIILSQVKPDLNDPLKQFHVLKEDEVYSEQPHKSFWLNLNDQLDDIDKEFGFPSALTQNHFVQDTCRQTNIDNSILEPVANEVQNKVPSQQEPESTEAPPVVDSSTPPMSPDEAEDASNDLRYSFKIEVLPSEEAKALYEKAQKQIDQGVREELMISSSSSQTEKDNNTDSTITSKTKTKSFQQIKEICCLSKLMEMYSLPVESPCRCLSEEERSCSGINNTTLNPDAENSPKSKDNETIALTSPQLSHKLDQIIDFLDDDNNFLSPSSEMSPAISQISSSSSSQVNTDSNSDSEDKDIFDTVPDISNEIIKVPSEDESPEELESTETTQISPSVSGTKQNDELCSTETEVILLSDEEEDYEQTLVKAAEEAASPLESKGKIQTSFSPHVGDETPKERLKRRSSPDQFFPGLKTPKKCKSPANVDPLDVPEAQPAASEKKTVELVLFGSGQQERGSLSENKKISSQRVSSFKDNPPEVLSVNMCPSRRMHSEGGHTENYSVKQLIYERWRKSVPTLNGSVISGRKKKLRRQKHLSASQSTSSKEEQQSASEFKTPDGKNKGSLSLKRRRSLSFFRRLDEEKRKRYSVTLGQLENQEAKEDQGENIHVMPLKENIVLKFSVLPNTFSFKDGSNLKETTDPVSDETKLVEEKDRSPEKASAKSKGMWRSTAAHQHQPLDAHKTVGLFYEYQKKYKEKTRSSSGDEIDKRT